MSMDDRILDAAMRVFVEVGLRGATTRRIAEEARVNEVTLFRRFGSKEQMLLAAMRRQRERGHSPLPVEPVEPERELVAWCTAHVHGLRHMRLLIRSTLTAVDTHPELCAAAHDKPRQIHAELVDYLRRVGERGLADPGLDAEAAASLLMGALFAETVGKPVLPDTEPQPAEEISARFVRLLLRAIGAKTQTPKGNS
jgi:AcrR family transcriptional regulator